MTEEFNRGKLKSEQIAKLREVFKAALADGRISSKELTQIQFFYYDSEPSESGFSALKDNVFKELVNPAIANHHVSEQARIMRVSRLFAGPFESDNITIFTFVKNRYLDKPLEMP